MLFMHDAIITEGIRRKFEALEPVLDERSRRRWAGVEAMAVGWGGVSMVSLATGLSRTTVGIGVRELQARSRPEAPAVTMRVRRPGGGSKPLLAGDPRIVAELEALIAPETRGDPMSPLRWTLKSTSKLAAELTRRGHRVSARKVAALLKMQDSPDKGRVTRYGVYDLTANEVAGPFPSTISESSGRQNARYRGRFRRYSNVTELLITADCGGSNSSPCRLWKIALQELADATGLTLHVSHFPPGTSKWNKIEHRLFCHVTQNWRGRPLVSHDLIVKLTASTTTKTGLKVKAALDQTVYESGIKVTDQELEAVKIRGDDFHGEWNYSISPTQTN
jgi:hypothetical protein